MEKCYFCRKILSKDEKGLCKKLLGKNVKQFFCMEHLADFLGTDEDSLKEKLIQFKEDGCTLFM